MGLFRYFSPVEAVGLYVALQTFWLAVLYGAWKFITRDEVVGVADKGPPTIFYISSVPNPRLSLQSLSFLVCHAMYLTVPNLF